MKKRNILFIVVFSGMLNAQISLENNMNDNLIIDMKQNVATGDKPFVLPLNAMKADRKDKTNVNITTNTNLESSLLIYNTNTIGNAKGPYFWFNYSSTQGAWTPFVNSLNKDVLLNLNYLTNRTGASGSDIYSATNNPDSGSYKDSWINNIGDDINTASKRWQVMPSYSSSFNIYNTRNILNLKLFGFAEAYYSASTASNFSFEVGIFIDDKLAVYSPFVITNNKNRKCTYETYNLVGLLQNLSVGNHTIKVAVKNRNVLSANGSNSVRVEYNTRNSNCNNINSENKSLPLQAINDGILNIQIQENPSILNF
ncbi:hypothetical protein [Empedobacter tilapiae]